MAFDAHKNLAVSTVATAPSPASSGTTLSVSAGEGVRFPAAPFNATVWPIGVIPTPTNGELVRVTARTVDAFTIVRAQEGSVARAILIGDLFAETITAKALTDIESGVNFPQVTTGAGAFSGHVSLTNPAFSHIARSDQNGYIKLSGGPVDSNAGQITLCGRDMTSGLGGSLIFSGGDTPYGQMTFRTGTGNPVQWTIRTDGVLLNGIEGNGNTYLAFRPGLLQIGQNTTGSMYQAGFYNPNGFVGSITSVGSTTAFNTASDQRLKRDRGVATDTRVLKQTVVHDFNWLVDNTPGRGVFAQEAVTVAPFAVTVGTDPRIRPWSVDYSKYVPDLIVGWQQHDALVSALSARIETLTARIEALERCR